MNPTVEFISQAILLAEKGEPEFVPPIRGYSSDKVRRFLNQLCRLDGVCYLELGTHTGSTLIPALYGNPHAQAMCIDNFSLEGPTARALLETNIAIWISNQTLLVIEEDLFQVSLDRLLCGVNIYFVDGPHDRDAHYAAFARLDPVLAETFVAVVDDWRWEDVRNGTRDSFRDLRYHIEQEWELPSDHERDTINWWNRLYVALIHKDIYTE